MNVITASSLNCVYGSKKGKKQGGVKFYAYKLRVLDPG